MTMNRITNTYITPDNKVFFELDNCRMVYYDASDNTWYSEPNDYNGNRYHEYKPIMDVDGVLIGFTLMSEFDGFVLEIEE